MKTFFSWIGGIFIVLVLLAMCGVIEEEETTDKKAEPKAEQTETKPKTEAKPKEKTEEEKAVEQWTKQQLENADYKDALTGPYTVFNDAVIAFSQQPKALADNMSLMFNDDWLKTTAITLVNLEKAANELKAVQPTNDQTKAIQDLLNGVADHYLFVVANYPNAIDNRDISLMQAINNELKEAGSKLDEATLLMQNLNNGGFE